MFSNYDEALSWIHSRLRLGMKPGLMRMEWMLEKLGNPERVIKTVHIGGTNGKGSTVTYLRSILQEGGFMVGTFTSPYIEHFNERISINGVPVSDEDLVKCANKIKPLADQLDNTELGGPTEFEIITAIALYYFAKIKPVDLVIFEVGLGGRFDSTNVIYPLVSVITNIGLDHVKILGETHEEIAFEKAGIIKNGVPAVTAVEQPAAFEVIKTKAAEKKSSLYRLGDHFSVDERVSLVKGERFSVSTLFGHYKNLEISMIGKHQVDNAAVALMAAELLKRYYSFPLEESHIRTGFLKAYWPGRFEIISEKPLVILDGAHNEEGIDAFVSELGNRYSDKRITILFAALNDKKLDRMISKLDQAADTIVFTSFDFPRASSADELYQKSSSSGKQAIENWQTYLTTKVQALENDEILAITGSLYFLSEVKPVLKEYL